MPPWRDGQQIAALLRHMRQGGFEGSPYPLRLMSMTRFEGCRLKGCHRGHGVDAGVGDDDVDPPEVSGCRVHSLCSEDMSRTSAANPATTVSPPSYFA